ncbi:voltage-gated hydrogen channel 1 [Elysia marginata]|uniref:Voltage-gated hydrogen channel 1 n=1 Tax=Elysia marginata TaxID=1093978 RepID=A0AAV4H9H0_9GAST|nr:voltage-gated hydrogen channel 1 [Elysia marginata]
MNTEQQPLTQNMPRSLSEQVPWLCLPADETYLKRNEEPTNRSRFAKLLSAKPSEKKWKIKHTKETAIDSTLMRKPFKVEEGVVFDAVVVVTSIVVDLIFIKGLSEFAVDETIFVLAMLLPWRVIRVVNSLVMAVIDHEHVKLRLLYSRKKKLDKTVENLRNETDELKGMLQDVRQFCIKEGIDSTRIDSLLGKFAPRRRKDSKFYTLVKLVMSTASINNNDNDSISSSSMENDLRDYANRQSVLNEAASNEGTVSSLRQYLSVPFFSNNVPGPGSSAVSSDQESVSGVGSVDGGGGGDARRSRADSNLSKPSIFITAPPSDEKITPQGVDVELGGGRRNLCGSDLDGSLGSDADLDDAEFSDVFEEDEVLGERKLFLNDEDRDRFADSDSESATGKTAVAFYLGSRQSLDKLTFLQKDEISSNGDLSPQVPAGADSVACYSSDARGSDLVIVPNKNLQPQKFGRFLTVPMCTVPASAITTTALLTNTSAIRDNNGLTSSTDVDEAASLAKETQEAALEHECSPQRSDSDCKTNLATACLSSDTQTTGEARAKAPGILRQSSTSEERRKKFASSSPPRILSSLDMETARNVADRWMRQSLPGYSATTSRDSARKDSSSIMLKDFSHKGYSLCPPYGSPVPRRRLPEVRTRRKNYASISCRSDSSDSDIPKPLAQHPLPPAPSDPQSRDSATNANISSNSNSSNIQHPPRKHHKRRHHSGSIGRKRHSSGEGCTSFSQLLSPRQHSDAGPASDRARSESPSVSAMSLLKVPGIDNRRRSMDSTCADGADNKELKFVSSSRSMNDVTSDGNGNPFANNIGCDGKILRSSCLSLNSARHKRRGKSPHRVSFKVS